MQAIPKILFKVISNILIRMCAEEVLEYIIFWLLEKLAAHTKTSFDDELVKKVKMQYDEKKLGKPDANTGN